MTLSIVLTLACLTLTSLISGDDNHRTEYYSIQKVRSILESDPSPKEIDVLNKSLKYQNEWWSILLSQEIESPIKRDLVAVLDSIERTLITPPTSIQVLPGVGSVFSN